MDTIRIVCALHFTSGVRAGGLAGDLDRVSEGISSATIWGGVGCCAARLFPCAQVDRLVKEGGLSSLLWERHGMYYVPKPLAPLPSVAPQKRKEAKLWTWIPIPALQDFLKGTMPAFSPEPLFIEERQRSAAIDRCTNSAVPYFRKRVVPAEGVSGVLVADIPKDLLSEFKASILMLGDTGLGGERSSGWGHFHVDFIEGNDTPFGNTPPERAEAVIALGHFLPSEGEMARICKCASEGKTPLGYEITRVRGFVGESSDISKPTVNCLSAGSVFPFLPTGTVMDISPQFAGHPVFFNGRPPFLSLAAC